MEVISRSFLLILHCLNYFHKNNNNEYKMYYRIESMFILSNDYLTYRREPEN